jgi:hypothetical protein
MAFVSSADRTIGDMDGQAASCLAFSRARISGR